MEKIFALIAGRGGGLRVVATVRTATATAAAGRVLGWPGLARVVVLTAWAGLSMPQHWVCVCVVGGIEDDVDCLGTGARGGCSKSSTSMAGFVGSRWPRDGWVCSQPRCRWWIDFSTGIDSNLLVSSLHKTLAVPHVF